VRKLMASLITLALVVAAFAVGRASDRDETVMTVQVSSADHELLEGYFTLGDSATVMAKRGSALHNFLSRQRGRKIKVVLTESSGPELSRLDR
jgi:ABC-type phosphate/phosphonate transport system substrate-binding protein